MSLINDYFRLRVEMNLAQYPDDMVSETARDVELRIFQGQRATAAELAWLIEACERAAPKVHSTTVTDGLRPKESMR